MKKTLLLFSFIFLFYSAAYTQGGTGCWREVSAGQNFCLGIKTDGTLWGWGQNGNLLGLNYFTVSENLPIQIGTDNDWLTVSAGATHSLAVKTNGTLWAWGSGTFGQLGNGAFNNATWTVTQIGTATDWQSVSAGTAFSLAIKTTGTLWAWGLNSTGQLGDNTIIDQNIPIQIGTATDWLRIDAGNQHSLAVKTTGTLWAWGNNTFGQLGDGTNTTSLVPIQIGTATNWSLVSAGFDHSMALDSSNLLYTFGNNAVGQLCDGTNTASNVPIPISFNSDGTVSFYIAISAGSSFSLAIKNDNTLWSAGHNVHGQLAQGNNVFLNVLTQVGTLNTWNAISAGNTHSLAMENTLTLWAAGRDWEGQIGVGTNTFSYSTLQSIACPMLAAKDFSVQSFDVKLYPNPTNDRINISYTLQNPSTVSVKLTNIQGQTIEAYKTDKSKGAQTQQLDLSQRATGMYFLTITTDEGSLTSKIFKK